MSAITLPEDEFGSSNPSAQVFTDAMANPTAVIVGSDLFVYNPALAKWDRFESVNGQGKVTVFDAQGNPVSDTLDRLLVEIQKLRQGFINASQIEDVTDADLGLDSQIT